MLVAFSNLSERWTIPMTITHLVTHSGGFHADELLSSVVLTKLFPKAKLLRSRDHAFG
jgi:uncharacterized UPF0160 family protein